MGLYHGIRQAGHPGGAGNDLATSLLTAGIDTISRFNQDAVNGVDTEFGKGSRRHSQVLDEQDKPIKGLYACGNDRDSVMGGYYPSGGITIGPGLLSPIWRCSTPSNPVGHHDRALLTHSKLQLQFRQLDGRHAPAV